jgi:AcrR family transcriptional regulator
MPRSEEQLNDIRKQKKQLILDTALQLFAENGFHATSITQIAQKAGISKGLTYNYFNSKNEILDTIVEKGFDSIYSKFDLNHDGVLTEEEFVYFIEHSFKVLRSNMEFWKLYFTLMFQPNINETVHEKYSETSEQIFGMFYQLLLDKGSKDPESDMLMITSLLKGAFLTAITAPELFTPEKLDKNIAAACFKLINK